MRIKNFKQSGYSLVELLIYIGILILILLTLIGIVFSFTKSYEQLGALRATDHTGLSVLDRMSRDIHSAASVDTGNSTFGSSSGVLTLNIGTSTTKFYTTGGQVRVDVNGSYIGPLSVASGRVTSLIFKLITTPESQAIKIDMTVLGSVGTSTKSKNYHTTAILKNS